VIDYIAATNPDKVLAFRPSEATMQRVSDLIYREETTGLSSEEKTERDHYMWLEHVMRMAKIRARRLLQSCTSLSVEPYSDLTVGARRFQRMVTIIFPDRATEKRALAFLLGRFSGRVLRSGEHLVPEAALEALADQNIPFTVKGKTTYEQQMAAIRGTATPPVQ
jgi:hypothetical protein